MSGVTEGAWYRAAVHVTLTASDSGSGVASITYTLDGVETTVPGPPRSWTCPPFRTALHTLTYHATDNADNSCAEQSVSFTIDTIGPVTAGKAASGRHGTYITLRYKATDNLSPKVRVTKIVVKNARGRVVKTFTTIAATTRTPGTWYSVRWKPSANGTYRYYVYAKDLAGNAQSKVGSARVIVR